MKPSVLVSSLVLGVFFAGCSPPPAPAPATPAPPPTTAPPPATVRPVPVAAVRTFDDSLLTGREFLWEVALAKADVRDIDLGILNANPELVLAVQTFLRGAWAGNLDEALLSPRWAVYLKAWAQRMHAEGTFVSARVGVERLGDSAMVPVKVTTNTKVWLGWVVLERGDKGWLVNDVQVEESAARTEPFDPESQTNTFFDQEISSPSRR